MLRSVLMTLLALLLTLPDLAGQQGVSGRVPVRAPLLELPAQDNDRLLAAERSLRRPDRPQTFAVTLPVDVTPARDGQWSAPRADTLVWQWRVRSPNAKSLNLGFTRFALPPGASLYLSTAANRFGPFTAADNADHAQFWSPLLRGDEIMVELYVPRRYGKEVDLTISSVNHDFEGVMDLISDDCHLDVACGAADGYPQVDDYRNVIRSVAAYTVGGGSGVRGSWSTTLTRTDAPSFSPPTTVESTLKPPRPSSPTGILRMSSAGCRDRETAGERATASWKCSIPAPGCWRATPPPT